MDFDQEEHADFRRSVAKLTRSIAEYRAGELEAKEDWKDARYNRRQSIGAMVAEAILLHVAVRSTFGIVLFAFADPHARTIKTEASKP